jgi:hypothetical protein
MDAVETKLLGELVQLARVMVNPTAKKLMREEFFKGEEPLLDRIRVYARLDGRTTVRDVAEAAGVGKSTVSSWGIEWRRKGLVSEDNAAVFKFFDFFPELEAQTNGE